MISEDIDDPYEDPKICVFMGSQFTSMITAAFGHISKFVPWQMKAQQSIPAADAINTRYTFSIVP
jgi:hypothetical protein